MTVFIAVLWKELTQVANRARFVLQKSLLALALTVYFLAVAYDGIYRKSSFDYAQGSAFALRLFVGMTVLLTCVLSVAALIIASSIVVSEHARKTLVFLVVSPLSSSSIVGPKLVGVCLRMCLGLLMALPIVVLLTIFGGVDFRMLIGAFFLIMTNVWLYASLGLWASVRHRTLVAAVAHAVFVAAVWNLAAGLLFSAFAHGPSSGRNPVVVAFSSPHVFFAFQWLLRATSPALAVPIHAIFNLLVGGLFSWKAARAFRPRAVEFLSVTPVRRVPQPKGPGRRWYSRQPRLAAIAERWFGHGIVSRELSTIQVSAALLVPLLCLWTWVLVAANYCDRQNSLLFDAFVDFRVNSLILAAESVLLVFALVGLSAGRIASEREAGTLQLLGLTALGPLRIMAGKAAAVLLSQSLAIALVFAHGAWMLWNEMIELRFVPLFLLALVLVPANAVTLGLYSSLPARRTAYAAVAVVCTLLSGFLVPVLLSDEPAYSWEYCPIAIALVALVPFAYARWRGLGNVLHVVSYSILMLFVVAFMGLFSATLRLNDVMNSIVLLPASVLFWQRPEGGILPIALYVFPIHASLFIWMALICLATFNAQLRRPA